MKRKDNSFFTYIFLAVLLFIVNNINACSTKCTFLQPKRNSSSLFTSLFCDDPAKFRSVSSLKTTSNALDLHPKPEENYFTTALTSWLLNIFHNPDPNEAETRADSSVSEESATKVVGDFMQWFSKTMKTSIKVAKDFKRKNSKRKKEKLSVNKKR